MAMAGKYGAREIASYYFFALSGRGGNDNSGIKRQAIGLLLLCGILKLGVKLKYAGEKN